MMRDCVDTPNCYCLAEAEEEGKRVVYPYELSNWSGFDLRATVVPIRHCPKCGKRLQPHMEECDNSTLYYTCKNCGNKENGWKEMEGKNHEQDHYL